LPVGGKRFSLTDVVVLVIGECLAVPFCIAGGEAFVNGHFPQAGVGFGAGIPLAIAAATFSFWKGWIGDQAQQAITQHATWWLPVAVLLAFAYVVGPDIYRRATSPTLPPLGETTTESGTSVETPGDVLKLIASLRSQLNSAIDTVAREGLDGAEAGRRPQANPKALGVLTDRRARGLHPHELE
jgi:hypothetical protein